MSLVLHPRALQDDDMSAEARNRYVELMTVQTDKEKQAKIMELNALKTTKLLAAKGTGRKTRSDFEKMYSGFHDGGSFKPAGNPHTTRVLN